jgi:hypothetical protein
MSPFDQALSVLALAGVVTAIGALITLHNLNKAEREIAVSRRRGPAE